MSTRETSKPLAKLASRILREHYIPTDSELRSMAGSLLSQYEHDGSTVVNFENEDDYTVNVIRLRNYLSNDVNEGPWFPVYDEDSGIFSHFAGGAAAIEDDDLDDFVAVAIAHGWSVETT